MTRLLNKGAPIDPDTEGQVGEALGRPPFKRSREGVLDLSPVLLLDTDQGLGDLRSWPHPKGSEARPSVSITILSIEEKTWGGQAGIWH
jgi:hypothetical protein